MFNNIFARSSQVVILTVCDGLLLPYVKLILRNDRRFGDGYLSKL